MMKHEYEEKFLNFIELFGLRQRDIDDFEEALWENICYDGYNFKYEDPDLLDIAAQHINYTKSISIEIIDMIQNFLESEVEPCFDNEIKFNVFPYEQKGIVKFRIESDKLRQQIGSGMNAYGLFDWNLHSEEDKQQFVDDGYLALRELLHYYEACCNKPKINLGKLNLDDFWEYDTSIEKIQEEIDEAEARHNQETN